MSLILSHPPHLMVELNDGLLCIGHIEILFFR